MRRPKPFFRASRNTWYVQIGKKQIVLARGQDAEKEAWQVYHRLMSEPRASVEITDSDSVAWLIDRYLVALRANPRIAETTKNLSRRYLTDFVAINGIDLTLAELRVLHVTEWLAKHPGWGDASRRNAAAAIKQVITWSIQQGLTTTNPLGSLRMPKARPRDTLITTERFREVVEKITCPRFRSLVEFAWLTGMRPQELRQLDWSHVDISGSRIVMPANLVKGKKAPRVVFLSPEAIGILQQIGPAKGHVFRNSRHKAWTKDAIRQRWRHIERRIGQRLCLYNLRHAFATRALESGVDSISVAVLMGHADASTIARNYQHLTQRPEHLRKVLAQMSGDKSADSGSVKE